MKRTGISGEIPPGGWIGGIIWWLMIAIALLAIGMPQLAAAADKPMTFSTDSGDAESRFRNDLVDGGNRPIWASGVITPNTTQRFLAFVRANGITSGRVFLDSPGGSLIEGVEFGHAIRKLRFNTEIRARTDIGDDSAAICASACAYVFAGGNARFYDQYSGRLGIHQFYSGHGKGGSEAETQAVSGVLVAFLKDMGVDSTAFTVAALTSPDGITWLTPVEAQALNFANNGVLPTTATIRTSDLKPALYLEQWRYTAITQAVFMCLNRHLTMVTTVIANQALIDQHLAGLKGAYVELDGDPALLERGQESVFTDPNTVGLTRSVSPDLASRLLHTAELHVWTENDSPVRWGGPIDLRKVHTQMADFFGQCFNPEEPTPSVLGQRWDLYIMDFRRTSSRNSMTMIDRASITSTGSLARARTYAVVSEPGHKPVYMSNDQEYDCAGARVHDLSVEFYKPDGKFQHRQKQDTGWQAYGPDTVATAILRNACGRDLIRDPKWALGDREPFAAMRTFLEQSGPGS